MLQTIFHDLRDRIGGVPHDTTEAEGITRPGREKSEIRGRVPVVAKEPDQGLGPDHGHVPGQDEHVPLESLETGRAHLDRMAGAQLLFLYHENEAAVSEFGADAVAVIAHDDHDPGEGQGVEGVQDVGQKRLSTRPGQHLGGPGLHPGPLARGQDEARQGTAGFNRIGHGTDLQ